MTTKSIMNSINKYLRRKGIIGEDRVQWEIDNLL
jgi:hypothetical protein